MAEQSECPKCEGAGKVASDNGKSWHQFRGLHYFGEEMTRVREGNVEPVLCPQCKGRGSVDISAPSKSAPAPPAAPTPPPPRK